MAPPRRFEKAKDFKGSIRKLFNYLGNHKWSLILAVVLAVASSILSVIGPDFLKQMTNIITKHFESQFTIKIDLEKVAKLGIILIGIHFCSAIFNIVQGRVMASTSQKVSNRLRRDINHKINRLPLKYIDSNSYGNLMSRTTNDVDSINQGLNNSFASLVGSVTLLITCFIMMFISCWQMALTAIISSIIGFMIISIVIKKSHKYFAMQQQNLGIMNGHIEETYSAHDIINVYNATGHKKAQFDAVNQNLYNSTWRAHFLGGMMQTFMSFIGNLGYVAICVVGAILYTDGIIEMGTIIAFFVYVRLFSNPLTQIAQSLNGLQSTAAASERVFEILDQEEIKKDQVNVPIDVAKIKGNVEFEHIQFGYNPDKIIINDFSASVKKGQKVAIVGPTGAGKTTLVNLLMRFYDLNSGKIKIDGIDIESIDRNIIHNIFGMVLQDTWLFEGTVRENLIFNQKSITDEQLDKICEVCGLSHFIGTLPNRYDTILDDNTTISQGQKQLLTIARAMIQNAPMLILDEATSSIDTRTEILIQQAIDKLTKGRTSFIIAHRLSTIKNADIIIVMKNGDIVEQGTHEELLGLNGAYAELYNSQFTEK